MILCGREGDTIEYHDPSSPIQNLVQLCARLHDLRVALQL